MPSLQPKLLLPKVIDILRLRGREPHRDPSPVESSSADTCSLAETCTLVDTKSLEDTCSLTDTCSLADTRTLSGTSTLTDTGNMADTSYPALPEELIDEIYRSMPLRDKGSYQNCSPAAQESSVDNSLSDAQWLVETSSFALPQDTINKMINHLDLPSHTNGSLQKKKLLVANSWVYTSKKPLDKHAGASGRRSQLSLDGFSQEDDASIKHIFHLIYRGDSCMMLARQESKLFRGFEYMLSRITLSYCGVSTGMLVSLINSFPNLKWLSLEYPNYLESPEGIPTTPFSRPPLKELHIKNGPSDFLRVLEEFSSLRLDVDEIFLDPTGQSISSKFVAGVVTTFGANVKHFRLPPISRSCTCDPLYCYHGDSTRNSLIDSDIKLDFSSCLLLRELELETSVFPLCDRGLDLIKSVESTNVEKIIIHRCPAYDYGIDFNFWRDLDDILIQFFKRPRNKRKLEVEFRGGKAIWGWWIDLPRFVEQGGRYIY